MISGDSSITFTMNTSSQDSSVTSSDETFRLFPEKPSSDVNLLVSRLIESALGQDGTAKPPTPVPTEEESRLAKAFPWLTQFNKMCQEEIGTTNISTLENLMTVYIHNLSTCINDCYLKPNRAAKLKRCMNDTLLLFHMFYSDIKKPLEHSSYLDKMSDLMAMYIDMEIKASRRGKESLPKIASKLTSSLYIFLDRSQDHILDAILKTKYMNKNFWELCVLIFSRVLRDSPGRAVYEMTYVRYVLVFKLWKKVVKGAEERRKVMKAATMKLFPPSQFREKLKAGLLSGVLPKIPKSRKDITLFLMQAKFCIREKTKAFLKAVADPKQQGVLGSQLAADLDRPLFFGDDADNSYNSNSDEQEDTSGSSMLMNDIWSSMSLESGITDHLRLASVVTAKTKKQNKNKARKNVIKCKGIATPVFKNDSMDAESNASDKSRKKKKKLKDKSFDKPESTEPESTESTRVPTVEIEVAANKTTEAQPCIVAAEKVVEKVISEKETPLPVAPVVATTVVTTPVATTPVVATPVMVTPVIVAAPVTVIEKVVNEVKPIENEISVANIKIEPESDDVCIIGYVCGKNKEQVNQVDSVCQGDKESGLTEVVDEVVIHCDHDTVMPPPALPPVTELPCQQADVSSVKVENSTPPTENIESNVAQVQDIFLYDEPTPSVWSPAHQQGYFNNTVNDFISDYLVHTKLPDFDLDSGTSEMVQKDIYEMFDMNNKSLNIKPKDNLFPIRGTNVLGELTPVPLEDEGPNANRARNFVSSAAGAPDSKGVFGQIQDTPQVYGESYPSHLDERETNQELINKMLETLHEQGRYSDKTQVKNQKVTTEVSKVVPEVEEKASVKGTLHDQTLLRDHKIFILQQKFRSFCIIHNRPPSIPVPTPLMYDEETLGPITRCLCAQCYANSLALITNYRILTHFKHSKINMDAAIRKSQNEELLRKIEESLKETKPIKDEGTEQDCSLPLKKRKTFSCPQLKVEEAVEPSYPCTPMMSIAALEESKNNMKPLGYEKPPNYEKSQNYEKPQNYEKKPQNYEAKIHPGMVPVDYTIANTSTSFTAYPALPPPTMPKSYNSAVTQPVVTPSKPEPMPLQATVQDNLPVVSGSYSPYPPVSFGEDQRIRFKTPAQLKEGSFTQRPPPLQQEITAAQDLINFAQNSHKYYSSQQMAVDTKQQARAKHRSKSDKVQSRKRPNKF